MQWSYRPVGGHTMATAAVIGLTPGRRLLSSSSYSSDINDKFFSFHDLRVTQFSNTLTKNVIIAKRSSNLGPGFPSNRHTQSIKALKEHVDTTSAPSTTETWHWRSVLLEKNKSDYESSLEVLILLQRSTLEKQWDLSYDQPRMLHTAGGAEKKIEVICSGISARQRRTNGRRRSLNQTASVIQPSKRKYFGSIFSPLLLQGNLKGYVNGVISKDLLSLAEVIQLSKILKTGLSLEKHRSRLKVRFGCEPSDEQLASSLRMSRAELCLKMIECSLAREKLAMSNVRLVMSIAQKYDNLGAEMADLIQGGLIGLLRGIEKFDSSKGFKISTYVYWWIRQGVSKALVENSRTLRLPAHLHERLCLIRNAKIRLEEKGITPSIDKIAKSLELSQKKVRNATEAVNKVLSLDREASPSLNRLAGETLHSYIADDKLENNPWHGVDEWLLKDEVNKLISATLCKREKDIICLYYGLGKESHTWEDISKQIGLSRERVRQVGLLALEKLKHAATKEGLEAMLVKH